MRRLRWWLSAEFQKVDVSHESREGHGVNNSATEPQHVTVTVTHHIWNSACPVPQRFVLPSLASRPIKTSHGRLPHSRSLPELALCRSRLQRSIAVSHQDPPRSRTDAFPASRTSPSRVGSVPLTLLCGLTLCRTENAPGLCVHRVASSPPRLEFERQ